MSILIAQDLSKYFGIRPILESVQFNIGEGEKVGLIGRNGTGKTTLLRILAGEEEIDGGILNFLPKTRLGYLPQDMEIPLGRTAMEEALSVYGDLDTLRKKLRELEQKLETDTSSKTLEAYAEIQHQYEGKNGYERESQVLETLGGLGLSPEEIEKPVAQLSGGQRTRVLLGKLLLDEPDLLLLDEPTNHLDVRAVEWLEQYLARFPKAVLVVSHDRYFLDQVAQKILELENSKIESYTGNYSAYAIQKQERLEKQQAEYARQQQEIEKLEEFIRRNHARSGTPAKQAHSREKILARMQRVERVAQADSIHMDLGQVSVSGNDVLKVKNLSKSFGVKPLFDDLELLVHRGERIGLVGPNGSGKSTLLKIILGMEEADSGKVRMGANVNIGYFAQDLSTLDPDNSVIEEFLSECDLKVAEARNFLAKFLFTGDDVFKQVDSLSGGERNRLVLAKLVAQKPNLLVLDEPTNHLDIDSQMALESALKGFSGTILFASHDRYLLDALSTRILEVADGHAGIYDGNYAAYHAVRFPPAAPPKPRPNKAKQLRKAKKAAAMAPPRRTLKQIEKEIAEAEERHNELTQLLASEELYTDGDAVKSATAEFDEVGKQIDALYVEWEARVNAYDEKHSN